jgi:hypothetical protein
MNIEVSPTTENYPNIYSSLTRSFSHTNSTLLIVITVILVIFFVFARYLGISVDPAALVDTTQPKSTGIYIIETIMWALLIFLILINGLQYFFDLDIRTTLHDIFSNEPKIDISVLGDKKDKKILPEIEIKKQVFHIPGNKYTYNDAKALCASYDSRLANQHEVDRAYRDGAEWCSYGWSGDQLALFPTQESTWFRLKKSKGHENDCGRPGINGGHIGNPDVKFGANCFGYKPEIKAVDRDAVNDFSSIPLTEDEKKFKGKVDDYKKDLKNIRIAAFNKQKWSYI